jgi:hypothetical protein
VHFLRSHTGEFDVVGGCFFLLITRIWRAHTKAAPVWRHQLGVLQLQSIKSMLRCIFGKNSLHHFFLLQKAKCSVVLIKGLST